MKISLWFGDSYACARHLADQNKIIPVVCMCVFNPDHRCDACVNMVQFSCMCLRVSVQIVCVSVCVWGSVKILQSCSGF